MKLILSRKGFDSSTGGMPSPILPDGTLLSLPVPDEKYDKILYEDLRYGEKTYADIMNDLKSGTGRKSEIEKYCHLDPDLRKDVIERVEGWKPAFGQGNAALTHLRNQKVKEGDLFLFFGWFKQTEYDENKLRYVKKADDLHVLYGYMEIGEIIRNPTKDSTYEWLKTHPHVHSPYADRLHNVIYVAADKFSLDNSMPGFGCFDYQPKRVLTKEGKTRGCWNLPSFFREIEISYHSEKSWIDKDDKNEDLKDEDKYFKSAGRGQEFVFETDVESNDDVRNWVLNIINSGK